MPVLEFWGSRGPWRDPERFVKLDPGRTADGGAGLGLSIARWVAEAHGGTLQLTESGAGRTTFLATLPYAHPAG